MSRASGIQARRVVPDGIGLLMCIAPLQGAYAVAQADQAAGFQAGLGTADPVITYLDRAPVIFKRYLHPELARALNYVGQRFGKKK